MQETPIQFLSQEDPLQKESTPVFLGFLGGSVGKESAFNAGDPGLTPGSEDPLEKGMATDFSILARRVP